MSWVRFARASAVALLTLACGHETFDLLPPPEQAGDGGTGAVGGLSMGGQRGGSAGRGSETNGGRSGRDAGPLPVPDCPDSQPDCVPCSSPYDCSFGMVCDYFRNYCAPFCGMGFDGTQVQCYDRTLPVCDRDRTLCVECTNDTYCSPERCAQGKCVPKPPPECTNNTQCMNPKPFCWEGFCVACSANFHCDTGKHCTSMGRCEPDGM
jgi:hypothetical protein